MIGPGQWFLASVHECGPFGVLDDRVEMRPGRHGGHTLWSDTKAFAHCFEDGRVRVPVWIVAVDDVVVRLAEQNLGVPGIRESMTVAQPYPASKSGVPCDRAVLRHQC